MMTANPITTLDPDFLNLLTHAFCSTQVLYKIEDCYAYGYDNSKLHIMPGAVVFPHSEDQVQFIVKACNEYLIPIVARGRGTGTVGGCVPLQGGVVLSFEKMQKIIQLDAPNRLLIAQPGVTNAEIQIYAGQAGFFWPPDPTSSAFCSLGGNLSYNSAGPRAVKYGTPRENTLGLRCITGNGDLIKTGTKTTKGVVGYDLTRLLIGSEGTLGIITEATLKLTPKAQQVITLQAGYASQSAATDAIAAIMAQPIIPYSLEFMDKQSLDAIRTHRDIPIDKNIVAVLMIALDGNEDTLPSQIDNIRETASNSGLVEFNAGMTQQTSDALWAMRKALSPSLRSIAPKKINEDVVVPVGNLTKLIEGVSHICKQAQIKNANFGHAGNGNIHVNLLVNPDDPKQLAQAETALNDIFDLVLTLEGSISGEHGTGVSKKPFIARELGESQLQLMHSIKKQFDRNGILNPGKI